MITCMCFRDITLAAAGRRILERRERMVRGKEERQKESKRQALRVLQQFCRRYQDMNIVHRRRKFESGVK